MSAPVDVLAVLQNEIDHAGCLGPRASEARARRLESVRAAVAGLIEALDVAAYGEYLPETVEQDIRAALARVQGGAR